MCSYRQHADFKFVFQIAQSIHHMLDSRFKSKLSGNSKLSFNESYSLSISPSMKMTSSARCGSVSECGRLCEVHVNSPESRQCYRHVVPICLFSHTGRGDHSFISLLIQHLNTQQTHCFSAPPQKTVCVEANNVINNYFYLSKTLE